MRRSLIQASLGALLAQAAFAQATTGTATAPPPAQDPVVGVVSDSAPASPSGFVFRVGGLFMTSERNYAINKAPRTGTGNIMGFDVLLRGSGAGLAFRSLDGTFEGQPEVISADASIIIGPPAFSIFLGGSKRALSTTVGTQAVTNVYTFGRVGLQTGFLIGGSGLGAQIGGWGYVPIPSDQARMNVGGEGEGSIIYTPGKLPIFLQLGYRAEIFTVKKGTAVNPEEVRGLRLGGGIQFGGE